MIFASVAVPYPARQVAGQHRQAPGRDHPQFVAIGARGQDLWPRRRLADQLADTLDRLDRLHRPD
ncbi:hypothetical protein NM680_09575 [Paracoccus sp. PS-1]|uniref:hypothetical protein n=1 Tax=unclassified Paracoccus (in: a-proteobacteria) TaxID=2688777 RepID=UPI00048AC1D0|nr:MULTISPECIES: hypothetical protein [unclassified Paracoccus (in: a-proteobacteria)]MDQ7262044.1 hypothetical protein [Paracoccus sp. PS1]